MFVIVIPYELFLNLVKKKPDYITLFSVVIALHDYTVINVNLSHKV